MAKQNMEMVQKLFRRFDELKSQKLPYNNKWDEIAEFVLPNRGDFITKRSPGTTRQRRLFDSTAIQANNFLASTLHGGLTNPSVKWFSLISANTNINAVHEVKQYLDTASNILFEIFNNPDTNFQSQNHELFLDLLAYGTACMYVDWVKDRGMRFKAIHLSEIYIAEDMTGHIDTVFREFEFTARQAAQFWGKNSLSLEIQKSLLEEPDKKFTFIHCVKPNEDFEPGSMKVTKLPFASIYLERDSRHLVEKRGYHEMPYLVPRWNKLVGETYGQSPAWNALPDIRMVNKIAETTIKAYELSVNPPIMMADDGVMLPLQTRPGGVNFGAIDPVTLRPRMQPFNSGADPRAGENAEEQKRKAIRDAYFIDPLLNDTRKNMTATEVLQRQEEKLRLIGPQIGRIQSEYLSPLIIRVYGIAQREGLLPQLDDQLADIVESGGLEIEYTAPLARTQRSQEPVAIQRTLELFTPLVQINPNLLDILDMDEAFRLVADINGVPSNILRSRLEMQQIQQAQQQQAQQQQQIALAVQGAEQVANLAKSGVIPTNDES